MVDIEKAKDTIRQAENQVQLNKMVEGVSGLIINELNPVLKDIANQMKESVKQYLEGIRSIKIEAPSVSINTPDVIVPKIDSPEVKIPKIELPEIKIPEIKIPEIKIDTDKITKAIEKAFKGIKIPTPEVTVKTPKIDFPKMKDVVMPDSMKIEGNVGLEGIDRDKPLHVIIVDSKGKYMRTDPNISVSGFGGGAPSTSTFNGLSVPAYDYVAVTYPTTTTERYTLKLGGSGGSVVATLLLSYSDATKSSLTSVEKV